MVQRLDMWHCYLTCNAIANAVAQSAMSMAQSKMPDMMHQNAPQSIIAMAWCKMLQHEVQCCSTKNKAMAWCVMLWNKEQCCGLKSNATASLHNAMAKCTRQQQWHQATDTQFDSFFPKKSLIKSDYFCIFNFYQFFPFWKVSGVLAPGLFWVGWCHHCPQLVEAGWLYCKSFLLGPTFQIEYA